MRGRKSPYLRDRSAPGLPGQSASLVCSVVRFGELCRCRRGRGGRGLVCCRRTGGGGGGVGRFVWVSRLEGGRFSIVFDRCWRRDRWCLWCLWLCSNQIRQVVRQFGQLREVLFVKFLALLTQLSNRFLQLVCYHLPLFKLLNKFSINFVISE